MSQMYCQDRGWRWELNTSIRTIGIPYHIRRHLCCQERRDLGMLLYVL